MAPVKQVACVVTVADAAKTAGCEIVGVAEIVQPTETSLNLTFTLYMAAGKPVTTTGETCELVQFVPPSIE